MSVVGITAQEQDAILYLIAGILHLGNIVFFEDAKKGNAGVQDPSILQLASSLLQVDSMTLQNALLFRVIQTGGGGGNRSSTYNVPQNAQQVY